MIILQNISFDKALIMGILNVTPDSFSDGGSYKDVEAAVERALKMIEEGADIIDIGGESTRPGFTPVSDSEELNRVIPVIKALREKSDILISVDTTKATVAREAMKAGANIINDISCIMDEELVLIAKEYDGYYILMHNRDNTDYNDFYTDYMNDMKSAINKALSLGLEKDRLILDPGVGFAKDYSGNLKVIKELLELKKLGYPVLLGASRKSVVGNALNLPVNDRLEGTLAVHMYGLLNGADILRVHDVEAHARVNKMTEAILNG